MNEKITTDELAGLLAQRKQLQQADAEAFVRTFMSLLEDALLTDRYVKVKGLGTLKIIDNDTEGRFVSYVPDTSLADAVNKPFSQFEPVLLKEGVHFDDMSESEMGQTDGEVKESQAPSVPVQEKENKESDEEEGQKELSEDKDTPSGQQNPASGIESDDEKSEAAEIRSQLNRLPWCTIATILLVGIMIGGVVSWTIVSGRQYIPESVVKYLETQMMEDAGAKAKGNDDTGRMQEDTLKIPDVANKGVTKTDVPVPETVQSEEPASQKSAEKSHPIVPLTDTVKYEMKGTRISHTLRRGESLARLAQKYYGNKRLWPYIARYNRKRIPDADNVPVGTVVLIPELVPEK